MEEGPTPTPEDEESRNRLELSLRRIDPLLQFLTKATGQISVPLPTLRRIIPPAFLGPSSSDDPNSNTCSLLQDIQRLVQVGILHVRYHHEEHSSTSVEGSTTTATTTSGPNPAWHWDNAQIWLGFPPPPSDVEESTVHQQNRLHGSLHGSTKLAAKRRQSALRRILKKQAASSSSSSSSKPAPSSTPGAIAPAATPAALAADSIILKPPEISRTNEVQIFPTLDKKRSFLEVSEKEEEEENDNSDPDAYEEEENRAREALEDMLFSSPATGTNATTPEVVVQAILPDQVAWAGSVPAQTAQYAPLASDLLQRIPRPILRLFQLDPSTNRDMEATVTTLPPSSPRREVRQLYTHQARAVEAAMSGTHVSICTATGSGKSLVFWLPVLTAAYTSNRTSLILFPTKALAQDQFVKLQAMLQPKEAEEESDLAQRIRPATLDGDTLHSHRVHIAESANIILTNPDTLHAAVLPSWRHLYAPMLAKMQYVVIDEAHTYEGVFGAHVAMVLSRLVRVAAVAAHEQGFPVQTPVFVCASATLPWPEHHFRLLCPVAKDTPVLVLDGKDDGSPRSAKHYFVWNPPILKIDGTSTGRVTFPRDQAASDKTEAESAEEAPLGGQKRTCNIMNEDIATPGEVDYQEHPILATQMTNNDLIMAEIPSMVHRQRQIKYYRRHAADETAQLLARAVIQGVRCIAFCKTRNLVEWVFERTVAALKAEKKTAHLANLVESYRGGYSASERRLIEQRLFREEVRGVVGTNALELGVDLGGIDLTLHCGYPSSYASLMQQSGRAGRGAARLSVPSISIVVCFNSPAEQHLWRQPEALLGKGVSTPHTIPLDGGLVQGHLLCAGLEFPLAGRFRVTDVLGIAHETANRLLSDQDSFGGQSVYEESLDGLRTNGNMVEDVIVLHSIPRVEVSLYKTHPSMKKAWANVNLRSIEPVNYAVVDLSHPRQGGRTDGIHHEEAVLDTVPYSRVFYHAHPGAILTHRGRKYRVVSMTRPPIFSPENLGCKRSLCLAAFVKPTQDRYATRPLSRLVITVIKQLERVEIGPVEISPEPSPTTTIPVSHGRDELISSFAGCGTVSIKRTVHGYRKLSLITRQELSRAELSLPPMEYDSYGLWIDTDPGVLSSCLGEKYGPGVHALSHALLAVAPLFAHGVVRCDLECDHSFFNPTQVVLFDERAGGSGTSEALWKHLFRPKGLLEAAIQLLEECSFCRWAKGYDGGCPACLHAANCLKFNMHLSRSGAIVVGKHMLKRIHQTDAYKQHERLPGAGEATEVPGKDSTPRRKARTKALREAKEMRSARQRQYVVGRPSWPLEGDESQLRPIHGE